MSIFPFAPCDIRVANSLELGFSVHNAFVFDRNCSMVISCPSCKKVFSRPLVMLNFEDGKTMLVNFCPYCNHVLCNAENEQPPTCGFQTATADKKLTY